MATSRCFGTKRGVQPAPARLNAVRPITQPGTTWPTATTSLANTPPVSDVARTCPLNPTSRG
ncbi:DUF1589 domain-containing protein [Rhodopirellula islandica]|uniref:DUF1589 domain-containing protein n=1 Tax=Rhodopirellula islandica TaxID=595434 RepID=UPI0012370BA7|nr:DUF1589 domain-containing protein [Rhodopirellula islandica]